MPKRQIMSTESDLSDALKLLGPALVLSTESERSFELLFGKLLTCLQVQDELEAILVRDFAEASWEIRRYGRLRGLSFERKFKQSLEFQVQRLKLQQSRKQERVGELVEHATMNPPDVAEATFLERKVLNSSEEMDEILKRTPTELDHAHSLEKSISFHKDVETIIASISRRRNEALHLLDFYQQGLGKRVEKAMSEIIDVEAEVVEQPAQIARDA